ncbi:MAG: ArsR family transcriptional regulator [Candidatus Hermodarchaeota archaeon]
MRISNKSNEAEKESNEQDAESSYYYALSHDIRRKIIKIIGENEFSTFTKLKKELGVSTGTIYHHLDTLSELIEQKKDKRYYLKELGMYAYNSLKNNVETIRTPDFAHRELKSPILRKLMWITSKRFIQFEKQDKKYSIIISIAIIILGTLFCALNGFYSFLLFFMDVSQHNLDLSFQILISLSFIVNFFVFFIIIEVVSRFLYKKNESVLEFLVSFAIILYPMIFYLIIHLIFNLFDLLSLNIFNLLDKVLLIIFQVWSLWLLSYSLCIKKGLKIESSLIISLLLHYGGFTIILVFLV